MITSFKHQYDYRYYNEIIIIASQFIIMQCYLVTTDYSKLFNVSYFKSYLGFRLIFLGLDLNILDLLTTLMATNI